MHAQHTVSTVSSSPCAFPLKLSTPASNNVTPQYNVYYAYRVYYYVVAVCLLLLLLSMCVCVHILFSFSMFCTTKIICHVKWFTNLYGTHRLFTLVGCHRIHNAGLFVSEAPKMRLRAAYRRCEKFSALATIDEMRFILKEGYWEANISGVEQSAMEKFESWNQIVNKTKANENELEWREYIHCFLFWWIFVYICIFQAQLQWQICCDIFWAFVWVCVGFSVENLVNKFVLFGNLA